jgi:uncharacterized membrane protein YeaQ/YmgE (transglycosylase-associated protein family)
MHILVWIISGIIAGWLTGLIMRGHGFGLVANLVIGLLGGLIGGFLARALGLAPTSWIGQILVAVLGGIVLVAVIRALRKV